MNVLMQAALDALAVVVLIACSVFAVMAAVAAALVVADAFWERWWR